MRLVPVSRRVAALLGAVIVICGSAPAAFAQDAGGSPSDDDKKKGGGSTDEPPPPPPSYEEPTAEEPPAAPATSDDDYSPPWLGVAIEPSLLFPVSDVWKSGSGMGIGGLLKLSHTVDGDLMFYLRSGYIHHLTAADNSPATSEVPILGGFRYWFFEGFFSPYITLETGATMLGVRGLDATEWGLKLSVGGGLGFNLGGLDLGAEFYAPNVGSFGDYVAFWLSLGLHLFSI